VMKGIGVVDEDIKKKNAEIDYVIELPSPVGNLRYFCKARSKKRCNDKDLSSALVDGQMKKMPVLFLYSDELSKKALELAQTDTFKTMVLTSLKNGN
jgi:hypothetical protein